ncbi:nucleotidyl transferase AbiEii/AbiGii toxin family protein [Leptospira noguchii]|uniref:nucleotidyl transferase AbiEii/AbiGii toxin family protein n=1 Tax=Leptospira noguchii TaxID=28182 RepID=UPI001F06A69B|nr:nucleotidyl transferase AbiEii/AbiGii toxin family protein [Leptospira noguchii]MCH1911858.1 nucleotidyl transferase AbiEii/AbiGii toxin family protein [Leptospira noguchii]MCH1917335.1 nucleotidyl transferase AbiEii/AbiGii toxin family protein [Leptospira noguchii]UOG63016.1 nucleotidyl transferase AbiEii/AbiGii toxin family protein [Leptospira noguchii]
MSKSFIHFDKEWKNLVRVVASSEKLSPSLIEKDYWIMHVLWSLLNSGLNFYMKGGTSLSKAYRMINRFSEDIDLLIEDDALKSKTARTDTSKPNLEKRRAFFDALPTRMIVPGAVGIKRDIDFDDDKVRNAGIRISYPTSEKDQGLKSGILLEVGFDRVEPYEDKTVTSWIVEYLRKRNQLGDYLDNRAIGVRCYRPEYTFVEKLQAISTKYRQLSEGKEVPNFARHYYDVYKLLDSKEVQEFIGTDKYIRHKEERFGKNDEKNLAKNEAFTLLNPDLRKQIEERYENTKVLYYGEVPSLDSIASRLKEYLHDL